MPLTISRLVMVIVLALALVGCAGAEAPGWTFGPTLAPSHGASTSPAPSANVPPSAPPASPATLGRSCLSRCGQDRDRGLRPRLQAGGRVGSGSRDL